MRLPVSAEQAALPLSIPAGVVADDSATRQELAIERRELRETLADTVRWLAARGLVTNPPAAAPLPAFSNAGLPDFPVSCQARAIGGHRRNV